MAEVVRVPLSQVVGPPGAAGGAPSALTLARIRAVGVVEPVLLRALTGGGYEVLTGHDVVAACRVLGLETVPAVVRPMDDGAAVRAVAADLAAAAPPRDAVAAELHRRLEAVAAADDGGSPPPTSPRPLHAAVGLLRILDGEGFTGTVTLEDGRGRRDVVLVAGGRCLATWPEDGVPSDSGDAVEDRQPQAAVEPCPPAVAAALARRLRGCEPRHSGLDPSYVDLPALVAHLRGRGEEAVVTVAAPGATGVVLVRDGAVVDARAWREGDGGIEGMTEGLAAVMALLAETGSVIDVHLGPGPEPIDLEDAAATY